MIGMLSAGMINKQTFRHFQACESTISSLRAKIRQTGSLKKSKTMPTDHVRPPGEDIDRMTSFRRNRFLSRARIPGLIRNVTGTRICAKTDQRRLCGVRLR